MITEIQKAIVVEEKRMECRRIRIYKLKNQSVKEEYQKVINIRLKRYSRIQKQFVYWRDGKYLKREQCVESENLIIILRRYDGGRRKVE